MTRQIKVPPPSSSYSQVGTYTHTHTHTHRQTHTQRFCGCQLLCYLFLKKVRDILYILFLHFSLIKATDILPYQSKCIHLILLSCSVSPSTLPTTGQHFGCFQLFTATNSATVNVFDTCANISIVQLHGNGISR